jgi:folate-binding protein YgfZ
MIDLDPIIEKYPNCITEGDVIKSYTNVKDEYLALKNGVGVKVCYNYAKIKLSGSDVIDYIHRISTNSVLQIVPYEHTNTIFTNEKGKIVDRTTLIRLPNYNLLIGGYFPEKKLMAWFERYIISEDIALEDYTDKLILLELIGKQTESFLSLMLDDAFNLLTDKNVLKCSVEGVNFYLLKRKEVNNFNKYWLLFEDYTISEVYELIMNNKSFYDLQFVGDTAYNIFRVENGIPCAPNEIIHRVNPHEVKLLDEVDFKKGCYIGQEVIARLDTYDKVQRYMMGILFEDGEKLLLENQDSVLYNEVKKEVGFVTSVIKSELYGKYAGLGFIKKDFMELGSVYDVYINEEYITKAIITEIPIKYENLYKNRG